MLLVQTVRCSALNVRANSLNSPVPWSLLLCCLLSQIGLIPSRSVQARERRKRRLVARLWVATVGAVGVVLTDSCVTETSGCQHALDEGVCGSGGLDSLILNFGNDWGQNLLSESPEEQAAATS